MASRPRILAFAGSTRKDSFNAKLIHTAIAGAREAGAEVSYIALRDYPLPLYDGDLETGEGMSGNGRRLVDLFLAHDGLLIAAPEYNTSVSGVLKNVIDWVSRPLEGQPPLAPYRGKVAGLVSTSPGSMGGLRGLAHTRQILTGIGVLVIPEQHAVGRAQDAFDAAGALKDPSQRERVARVGARLAEVAGALAG